MCCWAQCPWPFFVSFGVTLDSAETPFGKKYVLHPPLVFSGESSQQILWSIRGGANLRPLLGGGVCKTSFYVTPFTDHFFRFWGFSEGNSQYDLHPPGGKSTFCTPPFGVLWWVSTANKQTKEKRILRRCASHWWRRCRRWLPAALAQTS